MTISVVVPSNGGQFDSLAGELARRGYEVRRLPPVGGAAPAGDLSDDLVDEYFAEADAFLGIFIDRPITARVLARAPRLRIGVSPIIGTDTIDVTAASDLGLVIAHGATPENFEGVAEAVVMLTGALVKRLPEKWSTFRAGGWRPRTAGTMMRETTVGLVGFGNIGRATAARFGPFGTRLLAYDPYVDAAEMAADGVESVDLATLLRRSDVVSVMTVLTDETHHLIGEAEIRAMRPGTYLINTSRGPCVDEEALIAALEEGHLAGAAVDTFETEPARSDNRLRTMDQVIATGHDIGHSELLYETLRRVALEQLEAGLCGITPPYVRNPTALPAWRVRLSALGVVTGSERPNSTR